MVKSKDKGVQAALRAIDAHNQAFEAWWRVFWEPIAVPGILNETFKEVAKSAWDASFARDRVNFFSIAIANKESPMTMQMTKCVKHGKVNCWSCDPVC